MNKKSVILAVVFIVLIVALFGFVIEGDNKTGIIGNAVKVVDEGIEIGKSERYIN